MSSLSSRIHIEQRVKQGHRVLLVLTPLKSVQCLPIWPMPASVLSPFLFLVGAEPKLYRGPNSACSPCPCVFLALQSLQCCLPSGCYKRHDRLSTSFVEIGYNLPNLSNRRTCNLALRSQSLSYMSSHWCRPQLGLSIHAIQEALSVTREHCSQSL